MALLPNAFSTLNDMFVVSPVVKLGSTAAMVRLGQVAVLTPVHWPPAPLLGMLAAAFAGKIETFGRIFGLTSPSLYRGLVPAGLPARLVAYNHVPRPGVSK